MKVEEVVKVLTEFNKWRRGEPPYEWNEDPSKQMELSYSAKEVGLAIDEAINMLKHSDMMERECQREKRYEYTGRPRSALRSGMMSASGAPSESMLS